MADLYTFLELKRICKKHKDGSSLKCGGKGVTKKSLYLALVELGIISVPELPTSETQSKKKVPASSKSEQESVSSKSRSDSAKKVVSYVTDGMRLLEQAQLELVAATFSLRTPVSQTVALQSVVGTGMPGTEETGPRLAAVLQSVQDMMREIYNIATTEAMLVTGSTSCIKTATAP